MTTPTHEATTPKDEKLEQKLYDILIKYDVFTDIPNPIIASTRAQKMVVELLEVLLLARQEGERAGIDKAIKEVNEYLGYGFNGTSKLDKMSQDAMLEIITRNLNSLKDSHD